MKFSILTKTLTFTLSSLIIMLLSLGWYSHSIQTKLLLKMQQKQQQYIIEHLNNIEKDKINTITNTIIKLSKSLNLSLTSALYNMDETEIHDNIIKFLNANKSVKAILLFDNITKSIHSIGIKKNDQIIFTRQISNHIKKLHSLRFNMTINKENIGYMNVYYDTSDIILSIKQQKQVDLTKFQKEANKINQLANKKLIHQIYALIIAGIIFAFIIYIIITIVIQKQLLEFQKGLNSFFQFLQNPSLNVNKININTTDEFGQMATSVNKNINISMKMHIEMAQLMNTLDKNVITSETDDHGIITYVSEAFCNISGYTKKELLGKPHNIVRSPDMPKSIFEQMWKTIKANQIWEGDIKNKKKDGSYYWVHTIISPKCTQDGVTCGFTAIRYDITDKKKVEQFTQQLEATVQKRTKELNKQKEYLEVFFQNNGVGILIVDKNRTNIKINNKLCSMWGYDKNEILGQNASMLHVSHNTYKEFGEIAFSQVKQNKSIDIEYQFKKKDGTIFWARFYGEFIMDNQVLWVIEDITQQKEFQINLEISKKEIAAIHKHTRESIEYASLIQGALIPQHGAMEPFFKDHFVTWTPKDTVGGDIWLFNKLRHKDECLLFFIDCTGHGVPGAFVTMIVKSIEREIVSNIKKHPEFDISPAIIMGYFNKTMKKLLRQENEDSLSNAGWDGGIIYYNRRTQILKFAGAETPLFYIDENNQLQTIKGNRYSVGYKKCDPNYQYKETIINVQEGMKFFCTTDGYLDQNGGPKDFPFGKKRFSNIIQEYHNEPMAELQTIFQMKMMEWESMIPNNDRNDDITVIGFTIDSKKL